MATPTLQITTSTPLIDIPCPTPFLSLSFDDCYVRVGDVCAPPPPAFPTSISYNPIDTYVINGQITDCNGKPYTGVFETNYQLHKANGSVLNLVVTEKGNLFNLNRNIQIKRGVGSNEAYCIGDGGLDVEELCFEIFIKAPNCDLAFKRLSEIWDCASNAISLCHTCADGSEYYRALQGCGIGASSLTLDCLQECERNLWKAEICVLPKFARWTSSNILISEQYEVSSYLI